jgi:DNA-binding CsgD family transcriptional regulator
MLDILDHTPRGAQLAFAESVLPPAPPLGAALLLQVLDEVDHGLLLVDVQGQVVHANHMARHELATGPTIRLRGGQLAARIHTQGAALTQALERAADGQRILIDLGDAATPLTLAFVPMAHPLEPGRGVVLVICGKREMCQALTLRLFARNHGLTPAEEMVLAEACKGVGADDIASQLDVGVATVRTQLASIRRKTHCGNLRQLFRQLAVLPPLVSAIRAG